MASLDFTQRIAAARFRAWHRGTREADYIIGGFFDAYHENWAEAQLAWFERLIDEEDVELISWALGTAAPPAAYAGAQMDAFCKLDYVKI